MPRSTNAYDRLHRPLGPSPDDLYRVWPDGTVQGVEDGAPYSHLSDDYELVFAVDEEDAAAR